MSGDSAEKPAYKRRKIVDRVCRFCDFHCTAKKDLAEHLRVHHNATLDDNRPGRNKICSLCHSTFSSSLIDEHLTHDHDIALEKKILKFESRRDFYEWKLALEAATTTLYVKKNSRNSSNKETLYFNCNRDGYKVNRPKPNPKRILQRKKKDSTKMNAYCPARMVVGFFNTGLVEVEAFVTHVGHDFSLGRQLPLPKALRDKLAEKLAARIPFDDILQSLKEDDEWTTDEVIRSVTKKDLYNIAKKYGIMHPKNKRGRKPFRYDQYPYDEEYSSDESDEYAIFYSENDSCDESDESENNTVIIVDGSTVEAREIPVAEIIIDDEGLVIGPRTLEDAKRAMNKAMDLAKKQEHIELIHLYAEKLRGAIGKS